MGSFDGEADGAEGGGFTEAASANTDSEVGTITNAEALKAIRTSSPQMTNPLEEAIEEGISEASKGQSVANTATEDEWDGTEYEVGKHAAKHDEIVRNRINSDSRIRLENARKQTSRHAMTLAGQMRTLLLARSQATTIRDQRRGKLDRRRLATLNRPGYLPNRNVFTQTAPGQKQDVSVIIVMDCSGSMTGSKLRLARQGVVLLGDVLMQLKPLGVEFSAFGFTTKRNQKGEKNASRRESIRHYTFKSWDDDWRLTAARTMTDLDCRNNADADSVKWAVHSLAGRKSARKIMLVLSDGSPACRGKNYHQRRELKAVIQGAMKAGIEVHGIGIKDSSVLAFYPVCEVVNDVQELSSSVIKMAKQWLLSPARR